MAYSQLFISLGKEFMMAKILSYEWSLANSTINVNLPLVKKAMHVYLITKNDIIKGVTDSNTSKNILNYISSNMNWKNSVNHSHMNVLINKTASCYINSMLQCMARIPALTQLLLDTDLFQSMNESTFLYKYIALIRLMTEKTEREATMKKCNNLILDYRLELNPGFEEKVQCDATEFFLSLFDKFCEENHIFKFVRYHLFGFFREIDITCSNNHHSVSRRNEYALIIPISNCIQDKEASLYSGIINSMKQIEIEKTKCSYCIFEKRECKATFESYKLLHLPNILLIHLKRTLFDNNKKMMIKDDTAIKYSKYLTLQEDDKEVHYELIGLITHIGTLTFGHYLSYVLNPSKQWWLLDDLPKGIGEPTIDPKQISAKEVFSQNENVYAFFYRKINSIIIDNKTIDMVMDCYGQNSIGQSNLPNSEINDVAVAISFPTDINTPGVVSETCIDKIKQFKNCKVNSVNKLTSFLTQNKLKLQFWRRVMADKKKKTKTIEDNGTNGYQIEFLIHQRSKKLFKKTILIMISF